MYSVVQTVPGCGSANYSAMVVVNTSPALSATSNSPVCVSNPIYLNATALTPIFNCVWAGPNGYSSVGTSPGISQATELMAGVYTVTSTVPGCGSVFATSSVQVNQSITNVVSWSNSPLCLGQNLVLSANVVSGATYLWQGPNGFSFIGQGPGIPFANNTHVGQYSVTANVPGCGAFYDVVDVLVYPKINQITAGSNSPICT
jgi:hypothetical protein